MNLKGPMKQFLLLCLITVLSINVLANDLDKYLINPPQEMEIQEDCLSKINEQAKQLKNFVLALKNSDFLGEISIAQPVPIPVNFIFVIDSHLKFKLG